MYLHVPVVVNRLMCLLDLNAYTRMPRVIRTVVSGPEYLHCLEGSMGRNRTAVSENWRWFAGSYWSALFAAVDVFAGEHCTHSAL